MQAVNHFRRRRFRNDQYLPPLARPPERVVVEPSETHLDEFLNRVVQGPMVSKIWFQDRPINQSSR